MTHARRSFGTRSIAPLSRFYRLWSNALVPSAGGMHPACGRLARLLARLVRAPSPCRHSCRHSFRHEAVGGVQPTAPVVSARNCFLCNVTCILLCAGRRRRRRLELFEVGGEEAGRLAGRLGLRLSCNFCVCVFGS